MPRTCLGDLPRVRLVQPPATQDQGSEILCKRYELTSPWLGVLLVRAKIACNSRSDSQRKLQLKHPLWDFRRSANRDLNRYSFPMISNYLRRVLVFLFPPGPAKPALPRERW